MHVILTANYSPWSRYSGGGQRSTHNLAEALARRGHDVDVIFTKPPWEHVEVAEDLPYRLHWAALPALRSYRAASLRPLAAASVAWMVRRLLRCHPSPGRAVVHGQGEESALVTRLSGNAPFVLTPRSSQFPSALLGEEPPGFFARVRLAAADPKYLLLGAAARAATCCCPTSRSVAADVQRAYGVADTALEVIPNGVAQAFLDIPEKEKDLPRPSSRALVFFGRLDRVKGVDVLIDALTLLQGEPGRYDAPRLHIIGRGEEEARLRRRVCAHEVEDRVRWCGWKEPPEIARIIADASVAVLPSRKESFGNTMAEAMAAGAPLVSTTAGSIPEVVRHEETGLLAPPGDAQGLAAAVRRLLRNPGEAERLAAKGRSYARQHLTWSATAERFETLYRKLIDERAV